MKKISWTIPLAITAAYCIFMLVLLGQRHRGNAALFLQERLVLTSSISGSISSAPDHNIRNGKININTATVEELSLLPGIGTGIAQRIIEFREDAGSFRSLSDLLNVNGIGEKRLEQISDYITIGG